MKGIILAFTDKGRNLAKEIETALNKSNSLVELLPKEGQRKKLEEAFSKQDIIIFVGAAGICSRFIAPLLRSKDEDPAVIVIDELGRYVIPVLSGHIGGGNDFAVKLAELIGAIPIITTATDINGVFAIDTWAVAQNMKVANIEKIKEVSARLLKGEKIAILSEYSWSGNPPTGIEMFHANKEEPVLDDVACRFRAGAYISIHNTGDVWEHTLRLVPRILTVGIGCRRGRTLDEIKAVLFEALNSIQVDALSIKQLASIDLKKDETGIIELAKELNVPFKIATSRQLLDVEGDFTSSSFVQGVTGVDNVCERSAIKFAQNGQLILRKFAKNGVTIAICQDEYNIEFN